MKSFAVFTFTNITLSFWDNTGLESLIFDEISLDIYAGRIYRLSGENGSGKSSLVKLD